MVVVASQLVAEVKVTGTEQAKSELQGMGKAAEETQGGFKAMLGNALSFASGQAIFTAVGNAVDFLKEQTVDAVKEAIAHQQIMAQTVQALKSTRDASGETATAISNMADSLSQVTPYSQDAIQQTENLELTFTNIGKSVFPQATQAILDVSTAMHQDLQSSAIQVGKALGDPLTGMTALQRIGVTFTAQEKETVKAMMAHNNIAGAQKVILHELTTEFGDSATAAGKTFGGALDILKNKLDDLKIKIGTAVLPALSQLVGLFEKDAMPILQKVGDWLTKVGVPDLEQFASSIEHNATGCSVLHDVLSDVWSILSDLDGIVQTVVQDVEPFASGLLDAATNSGMLQDVLGAVKDILPDVQKFVSNVGSALDSDLLPPMEKLVTNVGTAVGNFAQWLDKSGTAHDTLQALGTVIGDAATVTGTLVGWVADLVGWMTNGGPQTRIFAGAVAALGLAFVGLKVADQVQGFANMFNKLKDGDGIVSNLASSFKDKVGKAIDDLLSKQFPNLKKGLDDVKGKGDNASTSVEHIGKAGEDAEKEVKTASGEMETEVEGVGKAAETTATEEEKIGTAAETAEGEVATASAEEETSIGDVGTVAYETSAKVEAIGTAAETSAGEVQAASTEEEASLSAVGAEAEVVAGEEDAAMSGASGLGGAASGGGFIGAGAPAPKKVWVTINGKRMQMTEGGFAEGGTNIAEGTYWVGERGPELMHVPQGANIYPHDLSMSMAGAGNGSQSSIAAGTPIILQIDGRQFARGYMPYHVDAIRGTTQVRF